MYRCLFCEFISGKTSCTKLYEDEKVFAFKDWNPWEGVHVVLFPKGHIGLRQKDPAAFARAREDVFNVVPQIVRAAGLTDQYTILAEDGEENLGQNEEHLHIHITGAVPA